MVAEGGLPYMGTVRKGSDSKSLAERPWVVAEFQLGLVM